jgi:predicted unusual protein kinase regulating ubiquinone biosynthesis (AarF/ABC1/UbiB family)
MKDLQRSSTASSTLSVVQPPVGRRLPSLRFRLRTSGIQTAASLAICVTVIMLRDGLGRLADVFRTTQAAELARHERRVLSAERLVATLGELKGIFAKVGQFGSLRHDLLAPEISEALAKLRDRVPPVPFDLIRETVEAELGGPLADRFSDFDSLPLGSASIAQVHRATLVDGTPVAVKVQYPWIAASQRADIALARMLLSAWVWFTGRKDLDVDRLFTEFAAGLADELDFRAEAEAARSIALNLADENQVVVPDIVASCSTARVLTMRYWPCVRIDDKAELARLGVSPREVLEVVARAYARQVFADGLFHADPHPGNLFVIAEPEAATEPRVLFVDFGLCKRLDSALRADLRKSIFAILQRDRDALVAAIESMGMVAPGAEAGASAAVATMFDRLAEVASERDGGVLGIGNSGLVLSLKDEAKRLLQETPGLQLPNDLILYAKTLSYLFALGDELDPEVDLMKISLPHLMKFLASRD